MAKIQSTHQQIQKLLREQLGTRWPAGSRLPAMTELARQLGVGQRNTLRAVQALAAEGLLESKPRRGTYVTEKARSAGRPAEGRRVRLPQDFKYTDGFIHEMVDAFVSRLNQAGATVDQTYRPEEFSVTYDFRNIDFAGYDALAIVNPNPRRPIRVDTSKLALSVVGTAQCVDFGITEGYDMVAVDEHQGGRIAGEAVRRTCGDDVFVVGVRDTVDLGAFCDISRPRLAGFLEGLGSSVPQERCFIASNFSSAGGACAGVAYAQMPDRPHAVFCTSDDLAFGFAVAAVGCGLYAGRDYALVGFDSQYCTRCSRCVVPITSVAVPTEAMGRRAADLLIQRLADRTRPVTRVALDCDLFEGKTLIPPVDNPVHEEIRR